jgi:hypothetical protein
MSAIEPSSASQQGVPSIGRLRRAFGVVAGFAQRQGQSPSTWRGIVWLISSFGIVLKPDVAAAIIAAGMAVSGLIGVLAGPDAAPPHAGGE